MSSFFVQRHRESRFLYKHRYWVERATPPEDYIYENLCVGFFARFARKTFVRFVVLLILFICAVTVTKLSAMSHELQETINWDVKAIQEGLSVINRINGTSPMATSLSPYKHDDVTLFCSHQLKTRCSTQLSRWVRESESAGALEECSCSGCCSAHLGCL